jgi:polar amino acid transport system substrate-binding protein
MTNHSLLIARVVLLALSVWTLLPASAGADAARLQRVQQRLKGELRWAGDAAGGAPYVLRNPRNPDEEIGFEVDLANALAEQLGVKARFVQYEWVNLVPGLQKGEFDIILNGLEMTPERRSQVLFTRPYYVFRQQLVVRHDEERIKNLDDCRARDGAAGFIVGTMNNTAAEKLLRRAGDIPVKTYDGQVEPYLDLQRRRTDAVLLDWPIALYYASRNPYLKFVDSPPDKSYYGIAVQTGDRELAEELNRALSDLMASGKLRAIYRKWHLWNDRQTELVNPPPELRGPGFDPAPARREAEQRGMLPEQPGEPLPEDAVDITFLTSAASELTFAGYFPQLLEGAVMTVFLSVTSFLVAMVVGLIVATCRLYGPLAVRWLALGYVEFFRGIPLFFLLFFMYYGLGLPAMWTAILGFGLNYAAFEAEIYRSSILAVPSGQWEAGRALGMSDPLIFRRIIFPQTIRTALGPMTNDFVALFKDTSLVSVIAVRELTKEYQILATSNPTLETFLELGAVTATLYLIMSIPLGYLSRYLEQKWGAGAG